MKTAIYVILALLFFGVIYFVNDLFGVREQQIKKFGTSVNKKDQSILALQKEIDRSSEKLKGSTNQKKVIVKKLNKSLENYDQTEMIKFSKNYFRQVGRNYRVFYMKDERINYLHRMWFDQIRAPYDVIKSDFPSIASDEGCCFVGEKDFFIVIPGTPIFKRVGYYKFDR